MKVTSEASKFSFRAATAALDSTLSKLTTAISSGGGGVREIALTSYKNALWAVGYSADSFAFIKVPDVKTDGDGSFVVDYQVMLGLLRGRPEFDFKFTGSQLTYKVVKGSYSGDITCALIDENQAKVLNGVSAAPKDEAAPITRALLDLLQEAFSNTNISDVYDGKVMFKYITLTPKGTLTVFSADPNHSAHYTVKSDAKGSELKLALPSSHFITLNKIVEEDQVSVFISSERLRVKGRSFLLVLPALQTDEQYFNIVPQFLANLPKPKFSCAVDAASLKLMAKNFSTLHEKNTVVGLSQSKSALSFTFKNRGGSATDSLKVSDTNGKIAEGVGVDSLLFTDTLSALGLSGDIECCVGDKWVLFRGATKSGAKLTYLSQLSGI